MKKITRIVSKNKYLLSILILSALLRFLSLEHTPPSLNWDEISHGYNAFSVLKTGRDEWGELLPLIFRAYGDYKLPAYIYLTAVSEAIFGLSTFSVRFVSALAGLVTVIFTYLLVLELGRRGGLVKFDNLEKDQPTITNHRSLALLSAFLVAVEPWTLFVSRGAFEANLSLAFITSGTFFFVKGVKNAKHLVPAAIFLGLSAWSYNSARIFVPVFILVFVVIYRIELAEQFIKENLSVKLSGFILLILLGGMFLQLVNPIGQARYNKVAILDEGAISRIVESRNTSSLSPTLARAVHNKPAFFLKEFTINWISHFKGDFLFTEGGTQYQFSVPDTGLLYLISLPFLLVGVFVLIKLRTKEAAIILFWFFLGPIASSITREAPHVLRSITMLPAPMVITACGFWAVARKIQKRVAIVKGQTAIKVFLVGYLSLLFFSLFGYLSNYYGEYRRDYSWSWQYGYREVIQYTKAHYSDYEKIIVTKKYGEPHEFFLFFWPWDPADYRSDPELIRFEQSEWFWVDAFDKFRFVNDWEIPKTNDTFVLESGSSFECDERCLLVTSPGNAPENWEKIETIEFLNGDPAFEIYEK